MKFKLSTLLLLVCLLSLTFAFYAYETGNTVDVDASYSLPVKISPHPSAEADIYFALVNEANLDVEVEKWDALRQHLHDPEHSPKPTNVREMHRLDMGDEIVIPMTETRSPLLNRKIDSVSPYDCVVILVKHELGAACIYKYEYNWKNDPMINVDLKLWIERSKE